jgi:hypothetical protein
MERSTGQEHYMHNISKKYATVLRVYENTSGLPWNPTIWKLWGCLGSPSLMPGLVKHAVETCRYQGPAMIKKNGEIHWTSVNNEYE